MPASDNEEFLAHVPHRQQGNMCETCTVILGENDKGCMSITVNESVLERFGISMDTLFDTARENTMEQQKFHIYGMMDILEDLQGTEDTNPSGK